jgi:leader peptidase (prepilin peptidase)/N-methyltransferase
LGGLAGALIIGAIFFLSRGKAIGFGDVILLGVLGFLFGWPDVVLILLLSFLIGASVSIILLIRRDKGMKDFVPFAPFIALSSLIVFFCGADLLRWYFSVFNPFG